MTSDSKKRRVLVCGGGNGAHCLSVFAPSNGDFEINVLSLFQDEADRWSKLLENSKIQLSITNQDGSKYELSNKPSVITKNPQIAIAGVEIIFLVVPAFAHAQYLNALLPYLQQNMVLVGFPGQAGFEFQCRNILGEKASDCTIVSFESLPWSCRLSKFGTHAQVLGFKDTLGMSCIVGKQCNLPFNVVETMREIIGERPKIKFVQNYIAINLMAKSMVHPPMMYGKWGNWDGKPLKEEPLFYQGIDERQANLLSRVSDEIMATAKKLEKLKEGIDMSDVIHIFDWYKTYYKDQITDDSSLMMAMRTNKAYNGLIHPMTKTDDGYIPNFKYRYTTEDIPYGLVVMKGIAEIAGVPSPVMDEIIQWGQQILEKEYIVGSKLIGKDIGSARAPQSFGLKTIDDLFNV